MDKKYKLSPEGFRRVSDRPNASIRMFYRLVAQQDIPEYKVKAGDLGGLITAKVELSQHGSCWVAKNARVSGNVVIDRSAYIGDEAVVTAGSKTRIVITDKVKIREQAYVEAEHISYLPRINSVFHGNADISGNAVVQNARKIADNARILGSAEIRTGVTIIDDSFISGNSYIGDSAKVYGTTVITDTVELESGATVKNSTLQGCVVVKKKQTIENGELLESMKPHLTLDFQTNSDSLIKRVTSSDNVRKVLDTYGVSSPLADGKKNPETGLGTPSLRNKSVLAFEETMVAIAEYEKDIVKVIKYPVMTDRTDSFTRSMIMSVNHAKRYLDEPESPEFKKAVLELENAFLAAESNAHRIAGSLLDEAGKKSIQKAQDLLRVAANEASSEQEKKVAFVQGFKQLEGVIVVPDEAVEAFRIKYNLKEIEA